MTISYQETLIVARKDSEDEDTGGTVPIARPQPNDVVIRVDTPGMYRVRIYTLEQWGRLLDSERPGVAYHNGGHVIAIDLWEESR
jgi:hypothetical protein